ncbi:uncharacterized protein LOC121637035 [Melanotaenia boesemani]|uniref:uncharacterized protein LOC121637035 n=1 Tax=Melanotaenia boesemani TaxID=1250792 RepID=UPI001C043F49|nr:uncharacterized protein LOC121637035 [Melanotaenia boesemani]
MTLQNQTFKQHIEQLKLSSNVITRTSSGFGFSAKKKTILPVGTCWDLSGPSQNLEETFVVTETGSGFSLSISNVSSRHAGLYWCGVKEDKQSSQHLPVTVTELKVEANVAGGSGAANCLIVGAVLLMLLLGTASIVFYKQFPCSKNKENGAAAEHPIEDHVYEEIQENFQKSENAVTTIYTTAKFTTNEPDSLHCSTVNFKNSSANADIAPLSTNILL